METTRIVDRQTARATLPTPDLIERSIVRDDGLEGLSDAPLPASWLIEGDPKPRIKFATFSPEGGLVSGIWTCEPAVFRFDYATFDETIHVLAGYADVQIGNEITKLRPGSTVYFPRGASSVWTVHEPIHKYFVQRNRNRVIRKLQAIASKIQGKPAGGLG